MNLGGLRRFGRPGLLGTVARTAVISGTAAAVTGAVARRRQQRQVTEDEATAYEQGAVPAAAGPSGGAPAPPADPTGEAPGAAVDDRIRQLQELGQLRDQGVLTAEEFDAQKRLLLGG